MNIGNQDESRRDHFIDRQLGISTCGIEEWDEIEYLYHRFESTSYRALDFLFSQYTPEEDAFLVDYGCGLGRVNFYFHHQFDIGGYGLEVHEGRLKRARENLDGYNRRQMENADIHFVHDRAEQHEPLPKSNLFYFFNPFVASIFADAFAAIVKSLERADRPADLILYYPNRDYLNILARQKVFKPLYLVDLPWNDDDRDYFMIYRH
ncbi:MAG: SAM-dependent methyltransferase [Saccharofermentanales bacterium]